MLEGVLLELPVLVITFLYFLGENVVVMTALPYITFAVCCDKYTNATAEFCIDVSQHPMEADSIQVGLSSSDDL